ncbi:MAG: cell envelope integrity protein TolA, partial [Alphaproteobacteria bacterium]
SELDAIRSQISRCWNVPVGAKDAENLVVDIRVHVNPDGTIREARILDTDRMQRDSFFRTAAESAYRAVVNPRCSPLRLPPEKYEQWKTFTLSFNPKEMFGT